MKAMWDYSKIIDLEFFIAKDSNISDAELQQRDRQFFLESQESSGEMTCLLWSWLAARIKGSREQPLPGVVVREAFVFASVFFLLTAFASGVASALVFCSYSGKTPINILPFLAIFVASQFFFVILVSLRHCFDWTLAQTATSSPGVLLITALMKKLCHWLVKRSGQVVSAEQLLVLQAIWGKMRQRESSYGAFFYWPIFLLFQRAGIVFNLGLFLAFFAQVTVRDLAFGWQSTLQFSAQSLYELVRGLSFPWSWFLGEGIGFPTLEAVEGSRIILKEGIAGLATDNIVSWWPFLVMSLLCYGLLPRLILFFYGKYRQHRFIAAFIPNSPAVRAILRRMETPHLSTSGSKDASATSYRESSADVPEMAVSDAATMVTVLFPDECLQRCSEQEVTSFLARQNFEITAIYPFLVGYEHDQEILEKVAGEQHLSGCIVFMEIWMPPLRDFLIFLNQLRTALPPQAMLRVTLLGRPDAATIFTPVPASSVEERIWRQKLESLGDPYLEITTVDETI